MSRLSFSSGFNVKQINKRRMTREFRKQMGGSKGLINESNQQNRLDITKPMNQYLNNPQEIENRKNVRDLEMALSDKNSLAKNWWDEGDNANIGGLASVNDEELIIQSRTSAQKLNSKLLPKSNPKVDSSNLKSIKEQLQMLSAEKKARKPFRTRY
jgi:hypothetical protein